MKKILIMCSIVLSGLSFAQDSDNPFIYDTPENVQEDVGPGNAGDPVDQVPIDQYIPALLIVATAIAFAFSSKKKLADNK